MRWILLVSLFFTLAGLNASAQSAHTHVAKTCLLTRSLSLNNLVDDSGIIFRGKFLGSTITRHNGLDVRELEFEVIDPIKGVKATQKKLTLKEWARVKHPFVDEVNKADSYIFFFHEPSARGLTSLNGYEQGLVSIGKHDQLKFSKRLSLKESRGFFLQTLFSASKPRADIKTYEGLKQYCQKRIM
jgi:hypothetical protein